MLIRKMVAAAALMLVVTPALAQRSHSVRGYTRKDGTYVPPHRATNPNGTRLDNWSTRGNVNPYTGKAGTRDPYAPSTPTYQPLTPQSSDADGDGNPY
jgi:hypothetical protein